MVSALFALAAGDKNPLFVYVAYVPALLFWLLDAYFLRQERLFRKLYGGVCAGEETDFSMDTSKFQVASLARVAVSQTLLMFHGAIASAVLVVSIVTGTS